MSMVAQLPGSSLSVDVFCFPFSTGVIVIVWDVFSFENFERMPITLNILRQWRQWFIHVQSLFYMGVAVWYSIFFPRGPSCGSLTKILGCRQRSIHCFRCADNSSIPMSSFHHQLVLQ